MTTTHSTIRRTAAVVAAAALALTACEAEPGGDAPVALESETLTNDTLPAAQSPSTTAAPSHDEQPEATDQPEPARRATPAVYAVATANRSIERGEVELATVALSAVRVAEQAPTADTIAEWIAALSRLERVLDADAIRALGDDPVVEQIAGPVDELDASVLTVIALLDPPDGSAPDMIGALTEVQTAVARWEAEVPGMEAAWSEAVADWTVEWEQATAEWEQTWADAVAEWELAWEQAVGEWEAEWEQAVDEWELAWAEAATEWEQAWADSATEWEQAWADAAAEWEAEWEQAVDDWQNNRGRTDPVGATEGG